MKKTGKNNYKKSSNKRGNRNSCDRSYKQEGTSPNPEKTSTKVMSANHMEWYNSNPRLVEDSARVNFTRPLGSVIHVESNTGSIIFKDALNPGVASFRTMLVPGYSDGPTSAVNIASRDIYSFVRFENSGKTNYDATQLMFYLLAVDQLHAWHEYLKRAYGVLLNYDQRSKYTPRAIIQAMGLNYDNLMNNIADFRWLINSTADRASIFHVPDGEHVPMFERHKFMFSGLYYDRDIEHKAQIYMFIPDGYFVWTETQRPFKLTYTRFPNALGQSTTLMTLDDLRGNTNAMLSALVESEDAQIISGDIYKAYGEGNLLTWDQMDETFKVYPTYDIGMLTQIHNMVWIDGVPKQYAISGQDVAEDISIWDDVNHNSIIFQPIIDKWQHLDSNMKDGIIDLPFSYPTSTDVMRATRLMLMYSRVKPEYTELSKQYNAITTFGTELITRVNIFSLQADDSIRIDQIDHTYNATSNIVSAFDDIGKFNQFDWFPLYNVFIKQVEDPSTHDVTDYVQPYIGERQNWTIIDHNTLNDINHTAIMSEFGIPIL